MKAADDKGPEDYCVCLLRSPMDAAASGCSAFFPGGELSPSDRALARANLVDGDDGDEVFLALRIAAVRRTFESAGIMVAGNPPPRFARQELQKILLREGPMAFHAFLDDWGIRFRPDDLAELAWFLMPRSWGSSEEHIFLVRLPDAEEVSWAAAGGTEFESLFWATPSRVLDMHDNGDLQVTLAQWYVLHELARCLPRLHALPDLLAADPQKDSPLWRPAALELCMIPAALGSEGAGASLALPGDEQHASSPGREGRQFRFLMDRVGAELKVRSLQRTADSDEGKIRSRL